MSTPKSTDQPSTCAKRQLYARLVLPDGRIYVAGNMCAPNGHSYGDRIETSECSRLARNKAEGKDWLGCLGSHAELATLFLFLTEEEVVPRNKFLHLVSYFARWKFHDGQFATLCQEFFDYFSPGLRRKLFGTTMELINMDWICNPCGVILSELNIKTHHPVAWNSNFEPSTSTKPLPTMT